MSLINSYREYPAETVTAVLVSRLRDNFPIGRIDLAKIWFRSIPPEVIDCYIDTGDPFNHAGAFDHQHPIINPYVDRIEGESESITGLPVKVTQNLLDVFNFR